jgi:pyruvate dehydrogenase E1 component beta subunit
MKEIRYIRAINEALREEMLRDPNVILIGEDIGFGGGTFSATRGLLKEFGSRRVIDTPISEQSFVGMALGAALAGLRPVVEIMFMNFIAVCMDQVCNEIAKTRFMFGGQVKVPITIRVPAGGTGGTGIFHSDSLEAWFVHVPGLKVVMPSTAADAKGLLKSSIRDDDPVLFIENLAMVPVKECIPEEEYTIPLGKADIKRAGSDVTVVAIARMVYEAIAAADKLAAEGISVEIVDPRTLSPLDKETILNSVRKTGRLVITHEAVQTGGVGAEIAAFVAEEAADSLQAPIRRVAGPFTHVGFSKPLEDFRRVKSEQIIKAVREIVSY